MTTAAAATKQRLAALAKADPATLDRMFNLLLLSDTPTRVLHSQDAIKILEPHLRGHETERLVVLALSSRGEVIDVETLSMGSDAFTIVAPGVIFRWALTRKRLPKRLVLAHNHPSGDADPSPQDLTVTQRMVSAGRMLDIQVVDHIIIAGLNGATSMADRGSVDFSVPYHNLGVV